MPPLPEQAAVLEYKGEYNGAKVYDDYAHHPDELHALLTTARDMGYQRLVVAFQPHTYSRTAKLFDRFVEELKLADVAILAEIYAAREQNTLGISSADLCQKDSRRRLLLHAGQKSPPSLKPLPSPETSF